jgi:N-acetylmuramoyl-L-alanine amidase
MNFIPSPNFKKKANRKITAIVIHYTGSLSIDSTIIWFGQKKSGVSAHYIIGRNGDVVQMVNEKDIAWHAGESWMSPKTKGEPWVNNFSIGIELVGTADSYFTDIQMAALYDLLETLVMRYKVPPDRVVGHADIAPGRKIDPDGHLGQFNWTRTREVCRHALETAS